MYKRGAGIVSAPSRSVLPHWGAPSPSCCGYRLLMAYPCTSHLRLSLSCMLHTPKSLPQRVALSHDWLMGTWNILVALPLGSSDTVIQWFWAPRGIRPRPFMEARFLPSFGPCPAHLPHTLLGLSWGCSLRKGLAWESLHLSLCLCAKSLPSPGSSVDGILQAGILEWVAISFFRGSSRPRNRTRVSHVSPLAGRLFATRATWEVPKLLSLSAFGTWVRNVRQLSRRFRVNAMDAIWGWGAQLLPSLHLCCLPPHGPCCHVTSSLILDVSDRFWGEFTNSNWHKWSPWSPLTADQRFSLELQKVFHAEMIL